MAPLTVAQQLGFGEANIAARVGFSVALGEHLAYGPEVVRARLAELGGISRTVLADVPGWAVVEEVEEPSAITTLAPVDGADPRAVREWLLAERRILTTYAGVERAPRELTAPVLRISPHVDTTTEDLTSFAEALTPRPRRPPRNSLAEPHASVAVAAELGAPPACGGTSASRIEAGVSPAEVSPAGCQPALCAVSR